MTQDTRRDTRAKDISVVVRYKSATVDDFIENHSYDVSKGGIFIKTSSPFAPGTLLKFELKLAANNTMIAGVGRVVWKREPADAVGPERPAGMGVKFIKIDDSSKAVIDTLVSKKPGAGGAFNSEKAQLASVPPPNSPTPRATMLGIPKADSQAPPAASASEPPPGGARPTFASRKATMMGLSSPPPRPNTAPPPKDDDEPPHGQEPTIMREASNLLAQALKEAGGSLDEVGNSPLFDSKAPPPNEPKKGDSISALPSIGATGKSGEHDAATAIKSSAEVKALQDQLREVNRPSDAPPKAASVPAVKLSEKPSGKGASIDPREAVTQPPSGKGVSAISGEVRDEKPKANATPAPAANESSNMSMWLVAGAIALIAGAIAAWKAGMMGQSGSAEPTTPAVVSTPVPSSPATIPIQTAMPTIQASAAPSATAALNASASASAKPFATASAATSTAPTPSASVSAKPTATAPKFTPPPVVVVPPVPKPTVSAAPATTATSAPKATAATPTETPKPPASAPAGDMQLQ